MIHPHTALRYIDAEIGYGVFALEPIPCGTLLWVHDALDQVVSPQELANLPSAVLDSASRYCYRNRAGDWVLCWDHARYINHSFHPNCLPVPLGFEIAIRDIQTGEEITNDYGCLNIIEPFEPRDPGPDRTHVMPDDLRDYHHRWDDAIGLAIRHFDAVPQPLETLLSDAMREEIGHILAGNKGLPSLRTLYYDPAS